MSMKFFLLPRPSMALIFNAAMSFGDANVMPSSTTGLSIQIVTPMMYHQRAAILAFQVETSRFSGVPKCRD